MLLLQAFVLLVTAAAAQGAPSPTAIQPANTTSLTKASSTLKATHKRRHGRIINGVDASDGYIYMAAVFADGSTLCGGTFISRSWILTAAQCVVGFSMWEVSLGITSLAGGDPGRITIVSATATANPAYSGNNYDAAVINTIVVEAVYLMPADLPFRSDTPLSHVGDTAVMTGWGATVAGGATVTTLKHANGSFAGECGAGYHVCIYTYNQVDITTGDYGGPLVVPGGAVGSWIVMGVAIGTDLSGNRSVFTNVHQNLDWIGSATDLPIYDKRHGVSGAADRAAGFHQFNH